MSVNETALTSDEEELHRLGYAQELRRRMSGFSNFAVSFTIISILSGCLTLYCFGMDDRRPGDHRLGLADRRHHDAPGRACRWPRSARASHRRRPVLLVGQAGQKQRRRPGPGSPAGSTSSARWRSPRASTSAPRSSSTLPGPLVRRQHRALWHTILIYAIVLSCTACSTRSASGWSSLLNDISVWWHIVGVLIIVGVLAFAPSHHQSAKIVFTDRQQQSGLHRSPGGTSCDRPAAGAVHLHRLRRLRAHDRGDAQRGYAAARAAS